MTTNVSLDGKRSTGTDLLRTLDRLSAIESGQGPILSVYLKLDPKRKEWMPILPRLKSLLDPIASLATSGELDHVSAMELKVAIEETLSKSGALERPSSPGVGLFFGPSTGLAERVDIPGPTWDCAIVGPRPYLRPLRAALDGFHRIAAVVIDARRAEIFTFYAGELLDGEALDAEELRKTNLAGWYGLDELRNRQHAEEVKHHLYREVAERLETMRADQDIDLVLVGGQHGTAQALLPFLTPDVQAMAETFVIDLHTLTPAILADRVSELKISHEERTELREVDETYSMAAEDGLGAVGLDAVFDAASKHAVSRLFLHDGATLSGSLCNRCGALSRPQDVCAVCGGETRKVEDVLEELARAVIEAGGSVEHVMADTRLVSDLIAARLRFRTE